MSACTAHHEITVAESLTSCGRHVSAEQQPPKQAGTASVCHVGFEQPCPGFLQAEEVPVEAVLYNTDQAERVRGQGRCQSPSAAP